MSDFCYWNTYQKEKLKLLSSLILFDFYISIWDDWYKQRLHLCAGSNIVPVIQKNFVLGINNKAVLSVISVFKLVNKAKLTKQSFTVKLTHSMQHSVPCFSHISHIHMQETLNIYTQTYHMFLLWYQMQDKSSPL